MKLHAISDLHVGFEANRRLWAALGDHHDDWLAIAGDVGETDDDLRFVLQVATARFQRVLWVPGNHELWTVPPRNGNLRGEARYHHLVAVCRDHGVLTPEDPYPTWPGSGPPCVLAPLFLLYDYSFRPDHVPEDQALAWARLSGVECADEIALHPDPHPSRAAWCRARCAITRERLAGVPPDCRTVLINHYPLRRDLARLPRIPQFSIWCGTRETESWHLTYRAIAVVSGHLHIRSTRWIDGVRFEEVSVGYPRERPPGRLAEDFLREILPGPATPPSST